MLLLGSRLIHAPILSLQTGSELARTSQAIIDPRNLTIVAYELAGPLLDEHPSLLRIADIRELSDIGMIVDSSDEFVTPSDIIKLEQIYNFHFQLPGLRVVDDKKHKLGRVSDYTLEAGSFIIEQLNVKRPLLQSLNDSELLIHRTQIIEITDTEIIVHATDQRPNPVLRETVRSYANPFRTGHAPQPEASRRQST
jgi:uncharacterized protein YrrD